MQWLLVILLVFGVDAMDGMGSEGVLIRISRHKGWDGAVGFRSQSIGLD